MIDAFERATRCQRAQTGHLVVRIRFRLRARAVLGASLMVGSVLLVACSSRPELGQVLPPVLPDSGPLANASAYGGAAGSSTSGRPAFDSGTAINDAGASSVVPVRSPEGGVDAGVAEADDAGPLGSGSDAAPTDRGAATHPMPADYAKPGPYSVKRLMNQGIGTITDGSGAVLPLDNSNDPSAFTLYFPENAKSGERFPLLTFGSGTFASPTLYDALIGHVVSHGFIVIATNTSNTGTAVEMLQAVEWALAQNDQSSSPIFGKVAGDHIGAFGHSQGGAGTMVAGADSRIDAIAPLSAAPLSGEELAIQCPAFYVTTENDVAPYDAIAQAYGGTPTPSVFGETNGGDHDEYTDIADDPQVPSLVSNDGLRMRAAIAAWFEWQLKAKAELRPLFVGQSCGFCVDPNWKGFESRGF
jgi:hypothetical protein